MVARFCIVFVVAVVSSACGRAPERLCAVPGDAKKLQATLDQAQALIAAHIGAQAAAEAFDVDVDWSADSGWTDGERDALGYFDPATGIHLRSGDLGLAVLVHEGFHSARWNSAHVVDHNWPNEWWSADYRFRAAICPPSFATCP